MWRLRGAVALVALVFTAAAVARLVRGLARAAGGELGELAGALGMPRQAGASTGSPRACAESRSLLS